MTCSCLLRSGLTFEMSVCSVCFQRTIRLVHPLHQTPLCGCPLCTQLRDFSTFRQRVAFRKSCSVLLHLFYPFFYRTINRFEHKNGCSSFVNILQRFSFEWQPQLEINEKRQFTSGFCHQVRCLNAYCNPGCPKRIPLRGSVGRCF
jgi:hypothetical protein